MKATPRTIVLLSPEPEWLAARMARLAARGGRVEVTLAFPEVHVSGDRASLAKVAKVAGRALVSRDGRSVPAVLIAELDGSGRRLAIAESCTGGLASHLVASVPGASAVFALGVVSYANQAKQKVLGVSRRTLIRHGAVSREVAKEMLEGVLSAGNADAGASVTGIAGPAGGSARKPVGLVHVGAALGTRRRYVKLALGQRPRNALRRLAAFLALKAVLDMTRERRGKGRR